MRHPSTRRSARGFTIIELLLVVFIITTITSMALPTLLGTRQRANYARAATDSRTLATLVLEDALQHDTYPGPNFIEVLRNAGYGTVPDTDPWGRPYAAAGVVGSGRPPSSSDDVAVYSPGPDGSGQYAPPYRGTTAAGVVGYSSIYGSFSAR
jgi:general secretion pathway protein G